MRRVQAENRFNNTHGLKMITGPSYFTSYRVTHDSLGKSRGDGVPHIRKQPPRFNVITGMSVKLKLLSDDQGHNQDIAKGGLKMETF